jgi:hypothetical protein
MRAKIVKGEWPPSQRIPTLRHLLSHFDVSVATMQRAVDQLVADGFVETRGRLGTFVADHPPHLCHYAMVFHGTPDDPPTWGGFPRALSSTAGEIERSSVRKFPQFYGIQGHADTEDYQQLRRIVQRQRLAGLIFTTNPDYLTGDPLLEAPGIPRVVLMSAERGSKIPIVETDAAAFFTRAVDYLADRGRQRIAVLFQAGDIRVGAHRELEDIFLAALQKRGLMEQPYWRQYVNVVDPTAVCRAVHLLLHAEKPQPPDALIVADDTMLDAAVNGLFAAGVRVPQDVEVIVHANFPVVPAALPVKRLGFDSRSILNACIRSIDAQRRGETVAPVTTLPAVFSWELPRDNDQPLLQGEAAANFSTSTKGSF